VYWRQTYRLITTMRAGLVSMIYRQTTLLKANDLKDAAAVTLMGTDVERIATSFRSIHEVWASTIEVGVAIWLLERQVRVACVVPVIISIGENPFLSVRSFPIILSIGEYTQIINPLCVAEYLVAGSVLAMIPVSTRTGKSQKQWIERVEKRLAVTSYILSDMKGVKMLGLTDFLFTIVSQLRQVELKTSERFRKLLIWQIALCKNPRSAEHRYFAC
jgi:ATP-binding cassette subfamily C (CFTR/MRP) protein 1